MAHFPVVQVLGREGAARPALEQNETSGISNGRTLHEAVSVVRTVPSAEGDIKKDRSRSKLTDIGLAATLSAFTAGGTAVAQLKGIQRLRSIYSEV